MANRKVKPTEAKDKKYTILYSDDDLMAHGGWDKMTAKLRALRDSRPKKP